MINHLQLDALPIENWSLIFWSLFWSGGLSWIAARGDFPAKYFILISGVRHFIVRFMSLSLTRNCSVTFLPRRPSPPFLKSLRLMRIFFNFSVGIPVPWPYLLIFLEFIWSGDSSVPSPSRRASGVRVPSSLKRSGGSWKRKNHISFFCIGHFLSFFGENMEKTRPHYTVLHIYMTLRNFQLRAALM